MKCPKYLYGYVISHGNMKTADADYREGLAGKTGLAYHGLALIIDQKGKNYE